MARNRKDAAAEKPVEDSGVKTLNKPGMPVRGVDTTLESNLRDSGQAGKIKDYNLTPVGNQAYDQTTTDETRSSVVSPQRAGAPQTVGTAGAVADAGAGKHTDPNEGTGKA